MKKNHMKRLILKCAIESTCVALVIAVVSLIKGGIRYSYNGNLVQPMWIQFVRTFLVCFITHFSVNLLVHLSQLKRK